MHTKMKIALLLHLLDHRKDKPCIERVFWLLPTVICFLRVTGCKLPFIQLIKRKILNFTCGLAVGQIFLIVVVELMMSH